MANSFRDTSGLKPPWQPGQSGNPSGRPKRPSMTTVLDKVADEKILTELVQIGIENAKRDFRYWQAIWDRLDGKVSSGDDSQAQTVNYDDEPEPAPEQLD